MIGVFQSRENVTKDALENDKCIFLSCYSFHYFPFLFSYFIHTFLFFFFVGILDDMKLLGYVQLRHRKYLVSHKISVFVFLFIFFISLKYFDISSKQ